MKKSNETNSVVRPMLAAMAAKGFIVVGQKLDFAGADLMLATKLGQGVRGIVWRNNTGAAWMTGAGGRRHPIRFGVPGAADIEGITCTGRFLAIECKMHGKYPTKNQESFAKCIQAMSGIAITVTSVEEGLDMLGKMELV